MKYLTAQAAWTVFNNTPGALTLKLRAVQRAFAKLNGLVE